MAKIFITGSTDGLGFLTTKSLIDEGHQVVLHARSEKRKNETMKKIPAVETILTGDLSNIEETKKLADQVNKLGRFDAVIHNAGVYKVPAQQLFTVNTLAPYILTCLIHKPQRLIYLCSGLHLQGHMKLDSLKNNINDITYSDTKLHLLTLCKLVARKWPNIYANAVNPGWVPTKMGGSEATDNLQKGYETQMWLAVSNENKVKVSGRYFFHQKESHYNPEADDIELQEKFLSLCQEISGISFPH